MTVLNEKSSTETSQSGISGADEVMSPEEASAKILNMRREIKMDRLEKFYAREDSQKIISWVLSQYDAAKAARARTRRKWLLNYAFYRGQQNLEFSSTLPNHLLSGRVVKSDDKAQRAINRVKPMIRTEIAKLTSQKPGATVIPNSSEDQDLFAAQAGEQVWECLYDRLNVPYHFSRAAFWTCIAGNGFLKVTWDSDLYDTMSEAQGDICVTSPTPFHLYISDIMEPELQKQPWVLHCYSKPVEWVKLRYEAELEGVKLTPDSKSTEPYNAEQEIVQDDGNNQAKPDSVAIYEMWIKAGTHKAFPKGGMITIINNRVVEVFMDRMPYKHGDYPFIKFDHVPTDTFYNDSVITDIIDLQRQYNSIRTKIAVTIKRMASMQLLAQEGSVNTARWNNEVGLIVGYRPGMPAPTPVPMGELPSYLFNELDRILMDIEDISGQHQVSKGNTPPGVTAATAISYLQEKDDSYLSPTFDSIERGFQALARQILQLAVEFWDIPRTIKVTGEDAAYDTTLLSGSDLIDGTDIRIEGGSALPQSAAAKRAFIMDLMTQGIIPPEEGLKFLEIGGVQKIVDNLEQDARAAKRENLKLKSVTPEQLMQFRQLWSQQMGDTESTIDTETGQPLEPPTIVPVNTWDNHEVHIEMHNQFRKSQAYELLAPEVKAEFERHVQTHQQVMLQETMQAMLQELPSDGTDDGGGYNPDSMEAQDSGEEIPQDAIEGLENLGG